MNKYLKIYLVILLMLLTYVCVLLAAPGGESVVLTRQTDTRKNVDYPVWDALVTGTWDDDDTADVTQAITINGIIQKIILVAPDNENDVSFQVVIRDNEDRTIFDSGEQPEDAVYAWSVHEPVTGTIDVIIGPSAALGTPNPDAIVTLRGI